MKKISLTIFTLFILIGIYGQNPCHKGGDDKGGPGCPSDKKCPTKPITGGTVPYITAGDPNLLVGPKGYDSIIKWVSVKAVLPYTINFENDPEIATAPAQKVLIYMPIPAKLNPSSLRIGSFGFGNLSFTVPANTTTYTQRLDVRDSLGVFLDVTAGLDMANLRAFWVFESIDPATGLAATLPPNSGFLPVNDSSIGNGEGFVTLTIQPTAGAQTRDTISAIASIVFDLNEAIPTNVETNTIDAVAPISKVNAFPPYVDSVFTVSWAGKDDSLGVGVKNYALYYSRNNGPFTLYRDNIDSTSISFTGDKSAVYSFYTRATDYTGNREADKTSGDQTVTVKGNGIQFYVKAILQGAYQSSTGLMTDSLRAKALLPATEPYRSLGFIPVNSPVAETFRTGLSDTTGATAIIDWVWLELRNSSLPSQIVATRTALIRRDGRVVEVDGVSPVYFNDVMEGNYYIAIRHRNHLGVMTATAIALNKRDTATIDFTKPLTATYGTDAQRLLNGVMMMWAGDANGNKQVKYNGSSNDKNVILSKVGLNTSNNVLTGYDRADVNLDGLIRYNGASNDKNVILSSVGLQSPNKIITEQIPN